MPRPPSLSIAVARRELARDLLPEAQSPERRRVNLVVDRSPGEGEVEQFDKAMVVLHG